MAAVLQLAACLEPPENRRPERYRSAARPMEAPEPLRDEASTGARAQDPVPPLTLPEAIQIALSGNPDIQIALARIRQAEARRREVSAVFLPQLSADTGYVWADAPSVFLFKTIDARELEPGTSFNEPGTFQNYETGVTARYNLFNGGRDLLEREIAETEEEISQLSRDSVENALLANLVLTFYDVLMAEAVLETATLSVETVRAQLQETEAHWTEGRVLESDVLSLRVRLAEAEEQRIQAANAQRLALATLASLLGLDPATELVLAGDEWEGAAIPEGYEDGLAEALARRPELERARQVARRAELELASAERAFLPRVDLEARAYWDDERLQYSGSRTNWFAGLALSWSLFEGGRRHARTDRSRALLLEMERLDWKQTLEVQLDLKRAYLRLEEAEARVAVTEASVEQAEKTLSLVETQYREGAVTVTRYLEAELALHQARVRRANAVFDLRKATADVARALGRFADRGAE